ncbi:MAG TPA: bifunctional 2-polyprenyl-6-hydroxyphenol methylase/3-demethylubiquinol 3-O-methyltransferase UbiG [Xanthobacteraceae bacterium]|nr:bifunctional 2-polyprenyl-6-hydroxyphenol methylase/3-demethylubiquinol 3-O-methyltransferase UbiG [Xanthobacteraceae bacterium]
MTPPPTGSTVDEREVAQFAALAAEWWDPRGRMGMLHTLNPTRLAYIRDAACRQFGRDPKAPQCLDGLRVLDIGCAAGILCEPLRRLGATVVGADPAAANIEAARLHAAAAGLTIDYRATTAEALAEAGERFDLVLAMEVVEHVANLAQFVRCCAGMVAPGGLMVASTINRTFKSFAVMIVGVEYVLRWLPRGTHHWEKFITPNELEALLARGGLHTIDETGVAYNILLDAFELSDDTDVNYMLVAEQPR